MKPQKPKSDKIYSERKGKLPGSQEKEPEAAEPEMPIDPEKMGRAKGDLATLMEAHEIQNDAERMHHVKAHAKKQMSTVHSIQDLKDMYNMKYGEGKAAPAKKVK